MTGNQAALYKALQARLGRDLALAARPRLDHQSNNLYDAWAGGEHYIVKEFLKPDEAEDAPRREFDGLRLVEPLDIAPRAVARLPPAEAHGPVVVYGYMDGEMWDRRKPSPDELERLAEVWLRLHALPAAGLWHSRGYDLALTQRIPLWQQMFTDYLAWTEAKCSAATPQAEACLGLLRARLPLLERLEAMPAVMAFCRSDARFANVIARPGGRLGMVDWEDGGLRDPAVDLADLLTHANNEDLLTRAEWQAFLEPYLVERSRVDPGLADRMQLYLGVFPVFWLAVLSRWVLRLAQDGKLDGWTLNTMPANERLRRWLARGRAWPKEDFGAELRTLEGAVFF